MASTKEPESRTIPLRLVFSLMVTTTGALLAAFLTFTGINYGFKWPGLVKSIVSAFLFVVCLVYGVTRGDKDLKLLREMPSGEKQVGFAHAGLIMLFLFALTALAMWICVGPPQSSVPGPL